MTVLRRSISQICRRTAAVRAAIDADVNRDVLNRDIEAATAIGGDAGDDVYGCLQRRNPRGSSGVRVDREATGRVAGTMPAGAEHLSRSDEDQPVCPRR